MHVYIFGITCFCWDLQRAVADRNCIRQCVYTVDIQFYESRNVTGATAHLNFITQIYYNIMVYVLEMYGVEVGEGNIFSRSVRLEVTLAPPSRLKHLLKLTYMFKAKSMTISHPRRCTVYVL